MTHSHQNYGSRGFRGEGPSGPLGRHAGFGDDDEPGHAGGRGHRGGGRGRGPGAGRRRGAGSRGGRPRGDVRAAVLVLLAEQPRHGYDLIRAIEERSAGAWTPSPGSIYPTLQALEDQGLIAIDTVEGRKIASLTDVGLAWVHEHPDEAATLFASEESPVGSSGQIRAEMMALRDAAMHVARHPSRDDKGAKAVEILSGARKAMYRLLAEDDD
ncbi:MAG: PadR family transcriptional regulator [Demequina sp.]|nr:PadR family transcriptional regulator [Demequina sp.]